MGSSNVVILTTTAAASQQQQQQQNYTGICLLPVAKRLKSRPMVFLAKNSTKVILCLWCYRYPKY